MKMKAHQRLSNVLEGKIKKENVNVLVKDSDIET